MVQIGRFKRAQMMGCDDSSEDGSRLSLDGSDGSSDDEFGCGVEMMGQMRAQMACDDSSDESSDGLR